MKTYTEKQIEEELSKAPYQPKPYKKDGVMLAKAGMRVFRKIKENKWELVSTDGIIPQKCNTIRIGRGGKAY